MIVLLLLLLVMHAPVDTQSLSASGDVPSIIIGGGRIGNLLLDLGMPGDVLVRRGEPISETPSHGPIYVCTRNDDLVSIIEATPRSRRKDLCFLQNGMLGPLLRQQGIADATQALLYLAVPTLGTPPVDGITALNPEGLTCATGPWAQALKARLQKGKLTCNIVSGEAFAAAALEKHIFICSTNLVGQLHGDLTVGEVYDPKYDEERRRLVNELIEAGEKEIGIPSLPEGTFDRLVAYGQSVPDFPTGIKEFQWRNGWFYNITKRATAEGKPDPLSLHTAALKKLGVIHIDEA
jgi:hypothetical protein